jgi:hypothetical protein
LDEFSVETSYPLGTKGEIATKDAAVGKVKGHQGQCLVHRKQAVSIAHDPTAITERLLERCAEGDANVLDGVVSIYVQVTPGVQREIEQAVGSNMAEHMVEKADPAIDIPFATAV